MTFANPTAFLAGNSLISTRESEITSLRTLFMGTEQGWVGLSDPDKPKFMSQRIENNRITGAYNAGKKLMRTVRLDNGEEITGSDTLLLLTVVLPEEEGESPQMILKGLEDIIPNEDYVVYNPWKDDEGRMSFQPFLCVANLPKGAEVGYALICEDPNNNAFVVNNMIVSIPVVEQAEEPTN